MFLIFQILFLFLVWLIIGRAFLFLGMFLLGCVKNLENPEINSEKQSVTFREFLFEGPNFLFDSYAENFWMTVFGIVIFFGIVTVSLIIVFLRFSKKINLSARLARVKNFLGEKINYKGWLDKKFFEI